VKDIIIREIIDFFMYLIYNTYIVPYKKRSGDSRIFMSDKKHRFDIPNLSSADLCSFQIGL